MVAEKNINADCEGKRNTVLDKEGLADEENIIQHIKLALDMQNIKMKM